MLRGRSGDAKGHDGCGVSIASASASINRLRVGKTGSGGMEIGGNNLQAGETGFQGVEIGGMKTIGKETGGLKSGGKETRSTTSALAKQVLRVWIGVNVFCERADGASHICRVQETAVRRHHMDIAAELAEMNKRKSTASASYVLETEMATLLTADIPPFGVCVGEL